MKKSIILAIAIVVSVISAPALPGQLDGSPDYGISSSALCGHLPAMAEEFSEQIPVVLDEMTKVTKLIGYEGMCRLDYSYEVSGATALAAPQRKFFASVMYESNLKNFCNNSDLALLKGGGVTIKHTYFDEDYRIIANHTVNKTDCNELLSGGNY